jgi:hypothetical protein
MRPFDGLISTQVVVYCNRIITSILVVLKEDYSTQAQSGAQTSGKFHYFSGLYQALGALSTWFATSPDFSISAKVSESMIKR